MWYFLYHVHTFEVRMHFKRLTSHNDLMYEAAMKLYAESFPIYEQRRSESQIKILQDNEYKFDLIYDNDQWLGIICLWETESFIYIEYFAINSQLRNRRYGQRSLQLLRKEYVGKKLILEIDPLVDDVAKHRKAFYERCGFVANTLKHVHPPYRDGFAGHKLIVMSSPSLLSQLEYDQFNNYLCQIVMREL